MAKTVDISYQHLLENPDEYMILRRITGNSIQNQINDQLEGFDANAQDILRFCLLDFETTGFDPDTNDPIELGAVILDYSPSQGRLRMVQTLRMLEEPKTPLSDEVSRITGLTMDDLKGERFDDHLLQHALNKVDFMLAHNAKFDRAFFDRRFTELAGMKWGCTLRDIDWYQHGYESGKLEYLLFKHGYFYSGHNALTDCFAMVQLMVDTPILLKELEQAIERPAFMLKAFGVPYEQREAVKNRGYTWQPAQKVWTLICDEPTLEAEQAFLAQLPRVNLSRNEVLEIPATARHT